MTSTRLIRAAAVSHRGKVRQENQDVIVTDHVTGLYAIFDGMGGEPAGEVAASVAGARLHEFVRTHIRAPDVSLKKLLELGIRAAGSAVYDRSARAECKGMGTTAIACLIADRGRVVLGYVGDSRAYKLRQGELVQLTSDHTLAQQLVMGGVLKHEEAEKSFTRNMLVHYLGKERAVCPEMVELTLEPGDRLLLCSDGLYASTAATQLREILDVQDEPARIVKDLVHAALSGEASDNISAIVIDVGTEDSASASAQR